MNSGFPKKLKCSKAREATKEIERVGGGGGLSHLPRKKMFRPLDCVALGRSSERKAGLVKRGLWGLAREDQRRVSEKKGGAVLSLGQREGWPLTTTTNNCEGMWVCSLRRTFPGGLQIGEGERLPNYGRMETVRTIKEEKTKGKGNQESKRNFGEQHWEESEDQQPATNTQRGER